MSTTKRSTAYKQPELSGDRATNPVRERSELSCDIATWSARWPSSYSLSSVAVTENNPESNLHFLAVLKSEKSQSEKKEIPEWLASAAAQFEAVSYSSNGAIIFVLQAPKACLELATLYQKTARKSSTEALTTLVISSGYGHRPSVRLKKMIHAAQAAPGKLLIVGEIADMLEPAIQGMNMHELGYHRFSDLTPEERIVSIGEPYKRSNEPVIGGLDQYDHNFPTLLDTFVGREETVEHIQKSITQSRIVTLTGLSGVGKTRLAVQAGALQLMKGYDMARVIRLAHLTHSSEVDEAVAKQIGLSDPTRRNIIATYSRKKCLLIFDGCENVLQGASENARKLAAHIPGCVIIATSHKSLGINGEKIIEVSPLETPKANQKISHEHASSYSAIQLFVDRMSERVNGFQLTEKNCDIVSSICRQLNGVALAIEHVAGQAAYLGLKMCRDGLATSLAPLKNYSVDDEHDQTVTATIEWSLSLLEDSERALLLDVSGIDGHFCIEDALAVSSSSTIPAKIEQDLIKLVKKSLVTRTYSNNDVAVYIISEPIRRQANLHLQEDRRDEVASKYLEHVTNLIRDAFSYSEGEPSEHSFKDISFRYSFVKKTLQNAIDADDKRALELSYKMSRYWTEYGPTSDGIAMIVSALQTSRHHHTDALHLVADNTLGVMLWLNGNYEEAAAQFHLTLESAQAFGDMTTVGSVLSNLGGLAMHKGDLEAAESYLSKAYITLRNAGDSVRHAKCAATYAHLLILRDRFEEAIVLLENTLSNQTLQIPDEARLPLLLNVSDAQRRNGQLSASLATLIKIIESEVGAQLKSTVAPAILRAAYIVRTHEDPSIPAQLLGIAVSMLRELGNNLMEDERGALVSAIRDTLTAKQTLDEVERLIAVGAVVDPDDRSRVALAILSRIPSHFPVI